MRLPESNQGLKHELLQRAFKLGQLSAIVQLQLEIERQPPDEIISFRDLVKIFEELRNLLVGGL